MLSNFSWKTSIILFKSEHHLLVHPLSILTPTYLSTRRDPEGVFGEPVTDDIAPNYSTIISQPMDLTTMATKIETSQYPSVNEFKVRMVLGLVLYCKTQEPQKLLTEFIKLRNLFTCS